MRLAYRAKLALFVTTTVAALVSAAVHVDDVPAVAFCVFMAEVSTVWTLHTRAVERLR